MVLARNVSSVSHRADMSRSSSCSARQGVGAADRPDRAWRSWQVSRQPHNFWVTLVKAAKKEAQAKAALLASVQAQQDEMILEASTRATIDALVGEGFSASHGRVSASRTLRDQREALGRHVPVPITRETRCDKLSWRRRSQRGSPPRLIWTPSSRGRTKCARSLSSHCKPKVLQMFRELNQDPVIRFDVAIVPQIRNTIQRSCSVATTRPSRLS